MCFLLQRPYTLNSVRVLGKQSTVQDAWPLSLDRQAQALCTGFVAAGTSFSSCIGFTEGKVEYIFTVRSVRLGLDYVLCSQAW